MRWCWGCRSIRWKGHKTWCTKDGFSFKMLADPEHKAVDAYGVPVKTMGTIELRAKGHFFDLARGQDREGVAG